MQTPNEYDMVQFAKKIQKEAYNELTNGWHH